MFKAIQQAMMDLVSQISTHGSGMFTLGHDWVHSPKTKANFIYLKSCRSLNFSLSKFLNIEIWMLLQMLEPQANQVLCKSSVKNSLQLSGAVSPLEHHIICMPP